MAGNDDTSVTPAALSPSRRLAALERSPSPRPRASTPSRLPSITAHQPFEFDEAAGPNRIAIPGQSQTTVYGFSPPPGHNMPVPITSSPRAAATFFGMGTPARQSTGMSPKTTSTQFPDHLVHFLPGEVGGSHSPVASPRAIASSPLAMAEMPPRSRRNSAAIVSISLSSRSRSRTPRGSTSVLPGRSGSGTPSKTTTPRGEPATASALSDAWAPGVDDMDDWQPDGGVLLDADQDEMHDQFPYDDYDQKRSWTAESEASRVADVLRPGMLIGEGLEFEGGIIEPAVGRLHVSDKNNLGLPLRRDGSGFGAKRLSQGPAQPKTYKVIRQLGSGSYAVVYLVREVGGRKREYALKCLSKHDLEADQLETQLFEATIHLSLPIHRNIVTLHETLQTKNWLFLMLELCPGEDLFYWLERSRDASPPPANARLPGGAERHTDRGVDIMSSSRLSSSSIPFSTSQMFSNFGSSFSNSPGNFSSNGGGLGTSNFSASPASLLFAHHNGSSHFNSLQSQAATPPTPSLLSAFSANTLLTQRRLRLIAAMFSQMCEAVAICHEAGVAHRDIKPENFICCDSVELESEAQVIDENTPDFGPQAKRKVIVKLTDFGLATTEEESGDVECGSKPYMSYECRNNLGPTYRPAPADVWSLGIVLINMLFHRNPWKDPTDGDPNFDTFMIDPISFFQSKFTGIGREVATYLAEHVLCTEVEDRVTARELAQWVRNLPDMIGGRRAMHQLKMARLETRKQAGFEKGMFVKSPIGASENTHPKSALASALASTSTKNSPQLPSQDKIPSLASLPPASYLAQANGTDEPQALAHPVPTPDLDNDEVRSATTVDDHPTPADMSALVSPEPTESGDGDASPDGDTQTPDADERSLSTHKRRKRGVRKGKAAQAALAAANDPVSKEERDAFLHELVSASEELARDLSKKKPFDANRVEDFPPLGTSPSQVAAAAARKPKWKDFLAMSKGGNQQLEALARRVAERDNDDTWSAPAKLQQGTNSNPMPRPAHLKQTATTGSGFTSSQLTSITSSTSSAGPEDDDWRRPARERERAREEEPRPSSRSRRGTEDLSSRARQAALAAAALTSGMEPMGSFGRPNNFNRPSHAQGTHGTHRKSPLASTHRHENMDTGVGRWAPPTSSVPMPISVAPPIAVAPQAKASVVQNEPRMMPYANGNGNGSVNASATAKEEKIPDKLEPAVEPKPKLKGQMSSLSKMFGGLKTKGGRE